MTNENTHYLGTVQDGETLVAFSGEGTAFSAASGRPNAGGSLQTLIV